MASRTFKSVCSKQQLVGELSKETKENSAERLLLVSVVKKRNVNSIGWQG